MKYQFKQKPTKVCNDCTLATTPFGDIIIFKENQTIIPFSIFYYCIMKNQFNIYCLIHFK